MSPTASLPGILESVAPILDRWGYLAIGGVIGVESFGVPAPGQTIMVAASIYAGYGRLNIYIVAIVSFVTAVLGDNIGYWIGLRGGRKVVHRWGRYIFVTPERLERAEQFFARRGNSIIVVARFIDGLRQLNGVIAGITRMPWKQFLLFNAIGAALWVGWWCSVAYWFGSNLVEIMGYAHKYSWLAVGLVIVIVGGYVTLHVRHVRRRRARAAEAVEPVEDKPAVVETPDPSRTDPPAARH